MSPAAPGEQKRFFNRFVTRGTLNITATGGVFSDWFYHRFLKVLNYDIIVHLLYNEKDSIQLKSWANKNNISYKIHSDSSTIPFNILAIDTNLLYDAAPTGAMLEFSRMININLERRNFESHARSVFTSTGVSDWLYSIYTDTAQKALSTIIDHSDESIDLDVLGPGPGYQFLPVKTPSSEGLGELTNFEYIQGAHTNLFTTGGRGSILINPGAKEFNLTPNQGLGYIGRIPPRQKDVVKVLRTTDIIPCAIDVEAVYHFGPTYSDNYHLAPKCLKNEIASLFKYCPDQGGPKHVALSESDLEHVIFAYEACKQDWCFESNSVPCADVEYVRSNRNWRTSPGYPYNKTTGDCSSAMSVFSKHIAHFVEVSRNQWAPTIYSVFGKTEVLPALKGDDIRTIIAPCLAHQIMAQQLTLRLSKGVSSNFLTSHTQIGRTRYHGDVARTAERISRFPKITEYDFKKYDRSVQAILLNFFFVYVWDVLSEKTHDRFFQLANMFESTIYSYMHVRNGELYRKSYGVPSGFTLTSYANSWIHTFLIYFSFSKLCPSTQPRDGAFLKYARDNFDFVCYGDDGLMGHSDLPWFDANKRCDFFRDVFNMELPVDKNITVDQFFIKKSKDGEVNGIVFLGDIITPTNRSYQPCFSYKKAVGTIIHGAAGRTYSDTDRVLIAFTHCVECFFHPKFIQLVEWLRYLCKKPRVQTSSIHEIIGFSGYNQHDFLDLVYTAAQSLENLRQLIWNSFYAARDDEWGQVPEVTYVLE